MNSNNFIVLSLSVISGHRDIKDDQMFCYNTFIVIFLLYLLLLIFLKESVNILYSIQSKFSFILQTWL